MPNEEKMYHRRTNGTYAQFVEVADGNVKDYWTGTANVTKTFTSPRNSLLLSNDGASDVSVTINGMTIVVKPTEVFDERFDEFASVTIATTSIYRAWARG